MRAFAFLARWALALLLFAWLLFAASWGALHWFIVPRIGELRPQLEATATHLLGVNVRIESIVAHWSNLLPAFELGNVRLMDQQGREALRLPRVLVSLSPRSLLSLKFDQIYIDNPTLNIRRSIDGSVLVAGLDLSKGGISVDGEVLHRVFSQPEFVIRHGSLVWSDELRGAAPLALRDVDLVLRNRSRRHELRLDATPPPAWGERFNVMAQFEQPFLSVDNGRWREWIGQAYAQFSRVDVAQLKRYADLGVDVDAGRGAVRAWVDIRRGRVLGATADLALADVALTLDPGLQALQLARLSGQLTASFASDGSEFATRDLAFDTVDGLHWPGGNIRLKQMDGNATRAAGGELVADRLDLAALRQIAARLPLAAPMHAALERYAPQGQIERINASWQGMPGAISKYRAEGRVQRIQVRSRAAAAAVEAGSAVELGSPGIQGATVDFDLSDQGGKASLTIQDGSVELPGVFEDPHIPVTSLSSDVRWQTNGDRIQVQVVKLRFSNPDADGELQLKWQTSDPRRSSSKSRFPGVLDLQGSLSRAVGNRVYRYLPLVVAPAARDYVRDAVQAGAAQGVRFKVRGDLSELPFTDPKRGEFLISANVSDALFAYVPRSLQSAGALPWPVLTQLSGELVFERQRMQVKGARASLVGTPGVQIIRADALIADLMHASAVAVSLDARGPLSELLAFVNASPAGAMTDKALVQATATGPAELRMTINVPINDPDRTTLQANLALQGNDVQLSLKAPRMAQARGLITFSESGFGLHAVQARMLGGEVQIDGGSVAPGIATNGAGRSGVTMAFRAQGTASAEGLRQARELGLVTRLAQHASGSAAYAATFGLRAGVPEFSVSSSLIGLALQLPAPLGKTADAAMPLRLDSMLLRESMLPGADGLRRLQQQWLLDLGRVGSASFVHDLSEREPRVLRGAIALGLGSDESAPLPTQGVMANLNVSALDLDAWDRVLRQLSDAGSGSGASGAGAGVGAIAALGAYWPQRFALRAREISSGGRKLRNLVAGGSRAGQTWRANLIADELDGYVEYRQGAGSDAAPGRLFARLSRLTLRQGSAHEVETLLDDQPASIPALDVVVDELELRGKKLGRVEVDAVNQAASAAAAGAREWRLNKLDLTTPDATFRASGNWAARNAQGVPVADAPAPERRTAIDFRLDINDSGALLGRFGMQDVVRGGKGSMQGQVAWAGSPLTFDFASLVGAFSVNVENGQFLKADPGLAKLFGVLSLQSLPRRLTLDFRDVFSEGFEFDFFRGDVVIERGVASSNNLQMKGVNAAVLMDGHADLAQETQDIRVVVVPEINAGTASLIATAINPAIGLGTFLAQMFLRLPLMEAATQEFQVSGSWLDPSIQRVDRYQAPAAGADQAGGDRSAK